MPEEVAATGEPSGAPGGPGGPGGPVDVSWLILQRLEDLRKGLDELKADIKSVRDELKSVRDELRSVREELERKIESVRGWSLGLLLLAILGLLAKLLIPGV